MSRKRIFAWILILVLLASAIGCQPSYRTTDLCITIVDVQHGDCILITEPNGHAMMIDTGLSEHRDDVSSALKEAGVKSLDLLILTHPHNDHIGNAVWVMKHYDVSVVYQIDRAHDSDTYRELEQYLTTSGMDVKIAKAGETFSFGDAACRFIGPISTGTSDINDSSAVLRIEYKGKSFLFMGDARWGEESLLMTAYKGYLDADFLKVGHHALNSTSTAFLKAVTPDIAVISTDDPKESDDPSEHRANIANIAKYANSLYRTDKDGDILIRYDGKTIIVKTEK